MGNILRVPLLSYSGSPRLPCHLQLPSAAINLSIDVLKVDWGDLIEDFDVLYTVDGSTCKLILTKQVDKHGYTKALLFSVADKVHWNNGHISFRMYPSKTGSLPELSHTNLPCESAGSKKTNRTHNAWGGCTDTTSFLYGWTGNRGGLYVQEWKTNSKDDPFVDVTVAHYFALNISTETSFGFSVVAKVRAYNNGKCDVTVEGPEQHPASALLYMFEEVIRTGIWKPTMCPHCAQTRKHLSRMIRQQSDTEDTDKDPSPPPPASRRNATRIDNRGWFRDGNGNFIENIHMYFRRSKMVTW